MFYVSLFTQLCRKLQARTKEIIKNAKVQLAKVRKVQRDPGKYALSMPKRGRGEPTRHGEQETRKLQGAMIFEG